MKSTSSKVGISRVIALEPGHLRCGISVSEADPRARLAPLDAPSSELERYKTCSPTPLV